jgi:hypothetical protein
MCDGALSWPNSLGLFLPKFAATTLHVFTQSLQNPAIESGIHSLDCWGRYFALPQLLYRLRHKSEYFGYHLNTCYS